MGDPIDPRLQFVGQQQQQQQQQQQSQSAHQQSHHSTLQQQQQQQKAYQSGAGGPQTASLHHQQPHAQHQPHQPPHQQPHQTHQPHHPHQPQQQQQQQQQPQPYYNLSPHSGPATQHALPARHHPSGLSQTSPQGPLVDPALEQQLHHASHSHHQSPVNGPSPSSEGDPDGLSGHGGHQAQYDASASDFKRPRACDSCRGLKVRCDSDPNTPGQPCRRCKKANRHCTTTPPTRKRQKKADSRVTELERKIDALTATLYAQKGGEHVHADKPFPSLTPGARPSHLGEGSYQTGMINHDWSNTGSANHNGNEGHAPQITHPVFPAPSPLKRRRLEEEDGRATTIPEDMDEIHRDIAEHPEIQRGQRKGVQVLDRAPILHEIDRLVPFEAAKRIFDRYVKEICPHFPAVPLRPGITMEDVRRDTPLLFLAILSSSCHGSSEQFVSQDAQRRLSDLLKDQFADIIFRNGEKSLEIVQALHVGVLWYRPPLHYEQHNFYMMVNCAAVMALDLGLGRSSSMNSMNMPMGPYSRGHTDANSIEARRTFVVCYYLCMSITMVLRRPILIRWSKYIGESVKILETSPQALPSDKMLCQHVKLARLGEKVSVTFAMDEPSAEAPVAEANIGDSLTEFEKELAVLIASRPQNNVDPSIKLAENVTDLYIHEIALHHNQCAADFQPPYSEASFRVKKQDAPLASHIGALMKCCTATHATLDTILDIDLEILVTLPVIFCVRAIYAIVCLMKLWFAVAASSEVASAISKTDLRLSYYTQGLVDMFHAIVSRDAQSPHGKFYFVAQRLQEKYAHFPDQPSESRDERQPEPSMGAQNTPCPQPGRGAPKQSSLLLLSEAAMGNTGSAHPPPIHPSMYSQPGHTAPPMPQAFYANDGLSQQQDMNTPMGLPPGFADNTFDVMSFDFGLAPDASFAALFNPDIMFYNIPGHGNLPGYNGQM